ncbi:MAG: hypothetical protein A2277_11855 [Desulfobacterales bacterium RIFOXYA12_FULL_46_15]|nr:MAG: hypothetical protein A2277_11855 [Desulfobacterales bacterium RIFOXYA12_FULL_46_15]
MDLLEGIKYNIKGIILALKTPKLLMLGLLRFVFVLLLTFLVSGLIFYRHDEILTAIWIKPDSGWLIYFWHVISYILSIGLAVISMVLSYLISQLLFCVFIMDYMSRITESMILGKQIQMSQASWFSFLIHLIKQEIPRAIIPVVITLFIMVIGLLSPLGPIIIFVSSIAAAVFLAWDNTDLVPARRMYPFRTRIRFLKNNLLFHIGFGILFLIPGLNIIFLSFAPVGATLSFIDREGV